MDGFETYKKAKKMQVQQNDQVIQENQAIDEFYIQKSVKDLDLEQGAGATSSIFDYDANELAEKFEQRNKGGAEDFKLRTEYYFTDTELAQAKADRYRRLASNPRERIKPFSRIYTNRWTNKRQKNASKASEEFIRMKQLMEQLKTLDGSLNSIDKYFARKTIMESRIKAMSYAAVTKSKSSNHEDYLKNRAKLSCYMILKDQLEHLIEGEDNKLIKDHKMIEDLNKELKLLQRDIENTRQKISQYAPSATEEWRNKNNRNDRYYRNRRNEYLEEGPYDAEKANLLTDLKDIHSQNGDNDWPIQTVLKDENAKPINKIEFRAAQWNDKYRQTKDLADSGNQQAKDKLKELDMQALERFDKMHIPTPNELKKENLAKYIRKNTKEYFDLFKVGLKYYNSDDLPAYIKEYKRNHPVFVAKLTYLTYIDNTINDLLRQDYNIQCLVDEEGDEFFEFERDENYRYKKDAKGRWRRNGQFRAQHFTQAGAIAEFEHYNKVIKAIELRNSIEKKRVNPLIKIAEFDQKDVSAAKNVPALTAFQKEEYNKVREQNPDIKESDWYFFESICHIYSLNESEYMKRAVLHGRKAGIINSANVLTGAHSFFLQSCNFKEEKIKGEGKHSRINMTGLKPHDNEIVEKNKAWIRLWTKGTDQETNARRAYIRENLPKFAEDFKFPSKEELESGAFMREGRLAEIIDYVRRANSFDDLKAAEQSVVTEVCKKNEVVEVRVNALKKLGECVNEYLKKNHLISLGEILPSVYNLEKKSIPEAPLLAKLNEYDNYLGSITEHFVEKPYKSESDDTAAIRKQYSQIKKEKNDLLSPDVFEVYITNNKIRSFYDNPGLTGLYSGDITKAPASLLRKVQYNRNNKPASDQDKLNDKWNADVLLAFESGNVEKINELVQEEIPGIYKDVKLPAPPQNATFEWIRGWVENEFIPNSEKWLDMFRRQSALTHLFEKYPQVKEVLDEDANLQIVKKQYEQLQNIVFSYMKMTYYLDLEQTGDEQIMTYDFQAKEANPNVILLQTHQEHLKRVRAEVQRENRESIDECLKEYSNAFKEMKDNDPDNSHIDNEKVSEKELKKFQKADPKFTEKGYEIYKTTQMLFYGQRFDPKIQEIYNSIERQEDYEEELEDAQKKKMKSSGSADRDVTVYFKKVDYDEAYKPAAKEDEENLQHNLDVLEAIKKGDQNKLDDILSEFIPSIWEDLELPPVPTEAEYEIIKNGGGILSENETAIAYKEKLEKYVDDMIESGKYKKLLFLEMKNLSINKAMDNNDALQLYMLDNPEFELFTSAIMPLTQLFEGVAFNKHHVDKSKGNITGVQPGSSYDNAAYANYIGRFMAGTEGLADILHKLGNNKFPKDKCGKYKRNREMTEADKTKVKEYREKKKIK